VRAAMTKIWLVIEYDDDGETIRAAYSSKELAKEHARMGELQVKEMEVLSELLPEAVDTPDKARKRAIAKEAAAMDAKNYRERVEADRQRQQEYSPAEEVAAGGGIRLCSCRTFSTDSNFVNPHGYCTYCGGTIPSVFRSLKGEAALQEEIDKLEEWKRIKMRQIVAGEAEGRKA
jgi:hypothetical protein